MSSETPSVPLLAPLHQGKKAKKKRPNFRPGGMRAKATPKASLKPAPKSTTNKSETESLSQDETPVVITQSQTMEEPTHDTEEPTHDTEEPALAENYDANYVDKIVVGEDDFNEDNTDDMKPVAAVKIASVATKSKSKIRRRPVSLARLEAAKKRKKSSGVAIGGFHSTSSLISVGSAEKSTTLVDKSGGKDQSSSVKTANDDSTEKTENKSDASTAMIDLSHHPLIQVPPEIPENTTGAPTLASFCTSFKVKAPKEDSETQKDPADTVEAVGNSDTGGNDGSNERNHESPRAPQGPAVQIINGEIVLQESSLEVDEGNDETENYVVVEEESQLALINATYASFLPPHKQRRTNLWNADDTALFYKALRQVGTDFGTMEAYFQEGKQRNRKQLKRKYQMELAKNPKLVERAMDPSCKLDVDLSVFELTEEAVNNVAAQREELERLEAERQAAVRERRRRNVVNMMEEENKDDEMEVVEEDATESNQNDNGESLADSANFNDVAVPAAAARDPLWALFQDEPQPPEEEMEDPIMEEVFEDPLFAAENPAEEDEEVAIALVPALGNKSKKKKPKFRTKKNKK